MGLFSKHKAPPVWKIGEKVCFLLQIGKNSMDKKWHMGEIAGLPSVKPREELIVDVWVYEIPEHFTGEKRQNEKQDEWSSLDPLPFDIPSEVILFSLLNSRTNVTMQKSARPVRVACKYLCRATVNDFRTAFEQSASYFSHGKQTFW